MEIRGIRTPGLGDTTYVLSHHGVGLVVDPQRDVDRFLAAARDMGAEIRHVLETHVHNDYVSGGRLLAGEAGARLVLPAGAGVAFDHVPAFHLEDLPGEAGLTVRPLHTPGHTPEHLSYLVLVDGRPVALFSGGSLLVGAAGRTDLLGQARARQLAILQYGSLRRLARLPDDVGLFPTHGEGSFCTTSGAGHTTSTIGQEKRDNPVFAYPDGRRFAEGQLAGLQPYPRYYAHVAPINILGPRPFPQLRVPELTPADVLAIGEHVQIVDARPLEAFAAGHIPGALGVELGEPFGTWVGWLLPFNAPLVLVLEPDQDVAEAVVQLGRIGFDDVRGVLRGLAAWQEGGQPTSSYQAVDVPAFADAVASGRASQVLDVRSPAEWEAGHLPGSVHRYVPDLAAGVPPELSRDDEVWVACGSGYRATIAAGLLLREGFRPVVLSRGGVPDVLRRLETEATVPATA